MTTIICEMKDCIYNNRKTNFCRCTAIGIKQEAVCDSYWETPEQLEKHIEENDNKIGKEKP